MLCGQGLEFTRTCVSHSRLQELVDRVLERFQSLGLIVKEWTSVKLHATVMNTLLRKDPNGKSPKSCSRAVSSKASETSQRFP